MLKNGETHNEFWSEDKKIIKKSSLVIATPIILKIEDL